MFYIDIFKPVFTTNFITVLSHLLKDYFFSYLSAKVFIYLDLNHKHTAVKFEIKSIVYPMGFGRVLSQ